MWAIRQLIGKWWSFKLTWLLFTRDKNKYKLGHHLFLAGSENPPFTSGRLGGKALLKY
jgi:hypothetical protein